MTPAAVERGDAPLVLAMPHGATWLPEEVAARLNARGRRLADTDWHIARLYEGLAPGATVVRACFHRYLVDANRGPDDASLYPGRNTTGLVPLTDFEGEPIWEVAPAPEEVAARVAGWHAPYHAALAAEVARLRAVHGTVLLWDCHSIRSVLPFLFEGRLPDLNVGTDGGASCAPEVEAAVVGACEGSGFSHVLNGRFRGGWTTRHYGRPEAGVHAIQMEVGQAAYLDEADFGWDEGRAARLRPVLGQAIEAAVGALGELA